MLQPIQNRSPESLSRNSFCNDKIEIELIELAQETKQIRRRFAEILFLTQSSNSNETFDALNWIPREQCSTLVRFRRNRFEIINHSTRRYGPVVYWQAARCRNF